MKAQHSNAKTTYLKDYRTPDFLVENCDLHFELGEDKTLVKAALSLCRQMTQGKHQRPLVLKGDGLKLLSLILNDKPLSPQQYQISSTELIIPEVPDIFTLEIVTEIYPQKNTALSGLYRSGKLFCTQCEAEGFRHITYYLDRPDVMAPFTTTIVADKKLYPVLLSNGNKIDHGEMNNGRHFVKWHDPFKKPSYLFALVAGPLSLVSDTFTTHSGKKVACELYVEPENIDKCDYAMQSLKHAMAWDEKKYGREYDLDVYMIVAVNDFNMGAMENKGLNIFNSKYILASEKTATDQDFQAVESVIGHEYFHNWTGNRITCRDWFQLSLKEGLTVFREQQFSEEMGSAAVKRINDVRAIRTRQFAEDAGPMAHPVRPESYIEINNFYTMTVYYKGAEVIRMLHTLLGEKSFRKGMDLYFERHDGEAVTIENFVASFADANDIDLLQFHRWYNQSGTPQVIARGEYDPTQQRYTLTLKQHCDPTPDQKEKKPFLIPINIGLYDDKGKEIALNSTAVKNTNGSHYVLLKDTEQTITFDQVPSKPIPSLLGNFSAPVKLSYPYTPAELVLLMTHDQDLFNRWDAAQQIGTLAILSLMKSYRAKQPLEVSSDLIEAYRQLLTQKSADPHLLSQLLVIPSFNYVAETLPKIDCEALTMARKKCVTTLTEKLSDAFADVYHHASTKDDGSFSGNSIGQRALKNVCLTYLVRKGDLALAEKQYQTARNMTDLIGALSAVGLSTSPLREKLFADFYQKWQRDPLVVNKWLALQAASELPQTLDNIKALIKHPAFDLGNPNKVYALINTFGASNPEQFHDRAGHGYQFLADRVLELNQRNPQVAARILEPLTHWKRFEDHQSKLIKGALTKIHDAGNLSEDVYELVTKSL
ncbi:MAG: aminopeptidase N [Candidatus Berkiellales bacterium]